MKIKNGDVRIHSAYDDSVTRFSNKDIDIQQIEDDTLQVSVTFYNLFIINPVYLIVLIPEHYVTVVNVTEKVYDYGTLSINFKIDMPKKLVLGSKLDDQFIEYMLKGLEHEN